MALLAARSSMAVGLLSEPEPVTLGNHLLPRLQAVWTPDGRHAWREIGTALAAPAVNRAVVVAVAALGLVLSLLSLGVAPVAGLPVWVIALTGMLVSGYAVKHTHVWPAALLGIAGLTVGALQLVLSVGG